MINQIVIPNLVCPYCGFVNKHCVDLTLYSTKHIVRCSYDDGGCDKDFIITTSTKISAKIQKIEGE